MKTIPLSTIRTNCGTQTRVQLNTAAVKEYGESMTEGVRFPPVTVFFDGADHWLADGFHRLQASMDIGALSIDAEVRPGDQRAARLFSTGANGAHGVPPTAADKRRAVMTLLQDDEWGDWSDRAMARQCEVAHSFVGRVRSSLDSNPVTTESSLDSESSEDSDRRSYKTKHGTTSKMKTGGVAESINAHTPAGRRTDRRHPARAARRDARAGCGGAPGPIRRDPRVHRPDADRLRIDAGRERRTPEDRGRRPAAGRGGRQDQAVVGGSLLAARGRARAGVREERGDPLVQIGPGAGSQA